MNEGAKAGIDFIHHLPESVQLIFYFAFGVLFIVALAALLSRPFR